MAANISNIMAVEPESRKALRNARRVLIKGMFDDGVLLQSFWYLLLTPSFIIHHPSIIITAGTSVVANEDGRPSLTRLGAICEQVADLHRRGVEVISKYQFIMMCTLLMYIHLTNLLLLK